MQARALKTPAIAANWWGAMPISEVLDEPVDVVVGAVDAAVVIGAAVVAI